MLNFGVHNNRMEEIAVTPKKKKEAVEIELDEKPAKTVREKKPVKKTKGDKEPEVTWYNDGRLAKKRAGPHLFSFALAVAFTSYLFTLADDQSEMINGGLAALADNTIQAKNAMGRLGAWLAHQFINNLFGLPSVPDCFNLLCYRVQFTSA